MSEKELICSTFFWCLIFCGLPFLKSTNLDIILCSWLNCQIPQPMGGPLGANAPWWGATTFQMSVKCLGGGWACLVKLLWTNHSSFTVKHFFFSFFIYEEQVDYMLLCICLVLYNNPSYSRILIGSRLWSIRGQTHDWRHHYKVFPSVF